MHASTWRALAAGLLGRAIALRSSLLLCLSLHTVASGFLGRGCHMFFNIYLCNIHEALAASKCRGNIFSLAGVMEANSPIQ